ncbi:CsbD family protein [Archangium violaceum]|uniref:CsbD family protein n=1 Tax=Archangium violaceum TaxID=83451 RepID=UPI00193BE568|nr:CsbD family protein [Archangium violaceum]QRK11591.1 CsbD family protein [Archangium violaceum]
MGEWMDKLKGRVKESVGTATGDRELEAEGKKDTRKGEVKGKVEEVKRVIKDADDEVKGRREP